MFGGSAVGLGLKALSSQTPLKHQHSTPSKCLEMSPVDRMKSVKGEAFQGNYLINAKERHSEKKNLQHSNSSSGYNRKSTSSHGIRYTVTAGS